MKQRLRLLIMDSDKRVHEPIIEADTGNASFLKLAAINGMQIIGVITEHEDI